MISFFTACKNNDMNEVLKQINKGETDYNDGLSGACLGGHKELALFMLNQHNDNDLVCLTINTYLHNPGDSVLLSINDPVEALNTGLFNACRGGHKELVELMISRGANDLLKALFWARYGKQKEIISLLQEIIN